MHVFGKRNNNDLSLKKRHKSIKMLLEVDVHKTHEISMLPCHINGVWSPLSCWNRGTSNGYEWSEGGIYEVLASTQSMGEIGGKYKEMR